MIFSLSELMFESYRRVPTRDESYPQASRFVPGLKIADVGERDQLLELVRRIPLDRLQQKADVIAEVVAAEHLADEPSRGVVEDRQSMRA